MIKRARRVPTVSGSDVENLVHECSIDANSLRLRSWYRQRDGVNRPGNGGAGENVLGEDISARLAGMLLRPVGDFVIPWDSAAMKDGAVHYVFVNFDGTAPLPAYRLMEVDQIAALCPSELRTAACYPHWQHKQYVYVADLISHICANAGIGIVPVIKLITDGNGSDGFTGPQTIVEARQGPLGIVGAFDHEAPANGVTYRDYRKVLPDGSGNPDHAYFDMPAAMPENWEFG